MASDALKSGNILADVPDAPGHEVLDVLLARGGVKLQRIVSHGQATQDGE